MTNILILGGVLLICIIVEVIAGRRAAKQLEEENRAIRERATKQAK